MGCDCLRPSTQAREPRGLNLGGLSLGNPESFEAKCRNGIAPSELVDLLVTQPSLLTDLGQDFLGDGVRGVGMGVVGLETDLVHADDVTISKTSGVIEDAPEYPAGNVAGRGVRQPRPETVVAPLLP